MYTSNGKHNSNFIDPTWCFLAEYKLSELMVDDTLSEEHIARLLFQIIWELGIPGEHIINIERTWSGFVREAIAHLDQSGSGAPVYIRLFCQKKALNKALSVKHHSQFSVDKAVESTKMIHHFDPEIYGGWGYFLIERSGGFAPGSSTSTYNLVDLYLYKEGK